MKYEKIGGLWIGGGAECLRSNRMKQNRETGEKQRKNSDIIAQGFSVYEVPPDGAHELWSK